MNDFFPLDRNKIWQEVSGALDMRQPGYYKDLLSKQKVEACQWWSDIEMVREIGSNGYCAAIREWMTIARSLSHRRITIPLIGFAPHLPDECALQSWRSRDRKAEECPPGIQSVSLRRIRPGSVLDQYSIVCHVQMEHDRSFS